MLSFCLKCRQNTQSKNPEVVKTKNRGTILLLKCSARNIKKSKFPKEQEARRLLNSLGIRASLSQSPVVGPIVF